MTELLLSNKQRQQKETLLNHLSIVEKKMLCLPMLSSFSVTNFFKAKTVAPAFKPTLSNFWSSNNFFPQYISSEIK
jgi:hypothetical protein